MATSRLPPPPLSRLGLPHLQPNKRLLLVRRPTARLQGLPPLTLMQRPTRRRTLRLLSCHRCGPASGRAHLMAATVTTMSAGLSAKWRSRWRSEGWDAVAHALSPIPRPLRLTASGRLWEAVTLATAEAQPPQACALVRQQLLPQRAVTASAMRARITPAAVLLRFAFPLRHSHLSPPLLSAGLPRFLLSSLRHLCSPWPARRSSPPRRPREGLLPPPSPAAPPPRAPQVLPAAPVGAAATRRCTTPHRPSLLPPPAVCWAPLSSSPARSTRTATRAPRSSPQLLGSR